MGGWLYLRKQHTGYVEKNCGINTTIKFWVFDSAWDIIVMFSSLPPPNDKIMRLFFQNWELSCHYTLHMVALSITELTSIIKTSHKGSIASLTVLFFISSAPCKEPKRWNSLRNKAMISSYKRVSFLYKSQNQIWSKVIMAYERKEKYSYLVNTFKNI